MLFSLLFAFPALGQRSYQGQALNADLQFEFRGFWALFASVALSLSVGALLMYFGRNSRGGHLFRKEAMAVVGLSWVLATILGALPFYFSGVRRCPAVRIGAADDPVYLHQYLNLVLGNHWSPREPLPEAQYQAVKQLLDAGYWGVELSADAAEQIEQLRASDPGWDRAILSPDPAARPGNWIVDNHTSRPGAPELRDLRDKPCIYLAAAGIFVKARRTRTQH